jgi:hypothetical protein
VAKSSLTRRKFPILSPLLLLVAYISFGWFLSDPRFPEVHFGGIVISIPMVLAIAWIWIICSAFISPLTSFSHFVIRWFNSDTVAFLSIFMFAATATFILFWMHIFLYILCIIATEALARVDIQSAGFANRQAFLALLVISLAGLTIGWAAREYMPSLINQFLPVLMETSSPLPD